MKQAILRDGQYGKPVLIGLSILLWLLIIILMYTIGYEETWQLWRVPTEMPPFVDFRLIPGSAESYLRGFEPSVENPFEVRERIFNYPTFWRFFFYSGVTEEDAIWIGISMIVLFFVAVFLFPSNLTIGDAIAMLLILFSPASMLLYERGNVDMIVFVVCVVSILLVSRFPLLAAAGLLLGAVMKMFPLFGISILLKESRSLFLRLTGVCAFVFLAYFFLTLDNATVAWNRTMRGVAISYGADVFFDRYREILTRLLLHWFPDPKHLLQYGPIVTAILLIVVVGIAGLTWQQTLTFSSERNLSAFRMGASIYIGTFLLGNNWDYRLAFLVLVVPQLVEWMHSSQDKIRSVAQICSICLALSCWHFIGWYSPMIHSNDVLLEITFIIDEVMNWTLLTTLAYLFVVSMPDWMKSQIKSFFPTRMFAHAP